MPNLVPRKRLEAANQLSLIATYGTAPVAALAFSGIVLLNGIVIHAYPHLGLDPKGSYVGIWIDSLSYLVSGLVIWRLDFPKSLSRIAAEQPLWRSIVEGWRFVGGTPLIRGLVVGMLGAFAAGGLVIGLGQQFAADLGARPRGVRRAVRGRLLRSGRRDVARARGCWPGCPGAGCSASSLTAAGLWLVLLSLVPNIVVATGLDRRAGRLRRRRLGERLHPAGARGRRRGARPDVQLRPVAGPGRADLGAGPRAGRRRPAGPACFDLPRTVHLGDDIVLTYTSAMATFLLAGLFAIGVGVMSFRQMDDRRGHLAVVRPRPRPAPVRRPAAHWSAAPPGLPGLLHRPRGRRRGRQVDPGGRPRRPGCEALGHEVVLTREPGGTPAGQQMRAAAAARATISRRGPRPCSSPPTGRTTSRR